MKTKRYLLPLLLASANSHVSSPLLFFCLSQMSSSGTTLQDQEHLWNEGTLTVLNHQRGYTGISHAFLSPDASSSCTDASAFRQRPNQPEKIPLSSDPIETTEVNTKDALTGSVANVKSLVSQILDQDNML